MSELDKLEQYLKEHKYEYVRHDEDRNQYMNRHQLIVYDSEMNYQWDAICHFGSYGYEKGLLEVAGTIVRNDDDSVEGWLTADEIIGRLEGKA